jgi:hypothetical protein
MLKRPRLSPRMMWIRPAGGALDGNLGNVPKKEKLE